MTKLISIIEMGNQLLLTFVNGETVIAYPTTGSLWIVGELPDVPPPPDDLFIWPFNPDFPTDEFGERLNPFPPPEYKFHYGMDASSEAGVGDGAPVIAAGGGIIMESTTSGGYGNSIMINHGVVSGDELWTRYAHMQEPSTFMLGDPIDKGETMGLVGSTGNSTGPHLHFETWVNGEVINPRTFMATYA